MMNVIKEHPMPTYSFDAVRSGVRNAIFGEAYVTIKNLSFAGQVTFHRPGQKEDQHKEFSQNNAREEPLTWKAIEGIIDLYNRDNSGSDLIVEGVGIYPNLVHELSFGNLAIRAAFLGYTDQGHADHILEYSRSNKDWVNTWLEEVDGDEQIIRDWIKSEVERSRNDKQLAEQYGYGFFDVSGTSFDEQIQAATNYLLENA
jgi:2-phosphoglycerate kinase